MKKILFVIIFLLSLPTANAEYSGWFIQFTIEKKDGKKIECHKYVASVYLNEDSLTNSTYLIKRFDGMDGGADSTIIFFRNRISYQHNAYGGSEKSVIYSLINKDSINRSKIKKITITEMIDFGYLSGIANKLSLKDTAWMKTKPIKYESAGGYLCDYQLFFHEKNNELDKLIKELKIKSKEASENYDDETLPPIIEKIMKYKVLVIATCTC